MYAALPLLKRVERLITENDPGISDTRVRPIISWSWITTGLVRQLFPQNKMIYLNLC